MQGKCRIKAGQPQWLLLYSWFKFKPEAWKSPRNPCQPPTVCLLGFAHKCEQHRQLHKFTAMPRPIRWEVTLLFISTPASAGQGDNPPSASTSRSPPAESDDKEQPSHGTRPEACQQGRMAQSSRLSRWMSTWVISTADSTHPWGLTAGRGYRDNAEPNPTMKNQCGIVC